jgi:hypothetical protein
LLVRRDPLAEDHRKIGPAKTADDSFGIVDANGFGYRRDFVKHAVRCFAPQFSIDLLKVFDA